MPNCKNCGIEVEAGRPLRQWQRANGETECSFCNLRCCEACVDEHEDGCGGPIGGDDVNGDERKELDFG